MSFYNYYAPRTTQVPYAYVESQVKYGTVSVPTYPTVADVLFGNSNYYRNYCVASAIRDNTPRVSVTITNSGTNSSTNTSSTALPTHDQLRNYSIYEQLIKGAQTSLKGPFHNVEGIHESFETFNKFLAHRNQVLRGEKDIEFIDTRGNKIPTKLVNADVAMKTGLQFLHSKEDNLTFVACTLTLLNEQINQNIAAQGGCAYASTPCTEYILAKTGRQYTKSIDHDGTELVIFE